MSLESAKPDDPRLLDRTCAVAETCKTSGAAERTTAITEDSVAYRLGPGIGSITIPLQREDMSTSFSLELLMAGSGSVQVAVPEIGIVRNFDVGQDYEWYEISGGLSSTDAGTRDNPIDMTISVSDDESNVELADLKAVGVEQVGACSVTAPGRR